MKRKITLEIILPATIEADENDYIVSFDEIKEGDKVRLIDT